MPKTGAATRFSSKRDVGDGFMQSAIPLLKEYTDKLQHCVHEANELTTEYFRWLDGHSQVNGSQRQKELRVERWQYTLRVLARLRERVQHLTNPILDLDRRVSQMIEHGQLESELDRVELKLRLNDLEGALNAAQNIDTNVPAPA